MQEYTKDKYFMNLAEEIANKSDEPGTHVGCVIVDRNKNIISTGYNHYVVDRSSKYMTDDKPMRYLLSVHAEMNALINAKQSLNNCIVYTTHASCDNCLKHLISAGVKEIIYKYPSTNSKFIDKEKKEAIIRMMRASGIINRNINGTSFENDIF